MNNPQIDQLQLEFAKGEEYGRVWAKYVEPFFIAKQKELYDLFCEHPTSSSDELMRIKLQVNALTALKDEFQHYINTGRMAKIQLEENSDG